MPGMALHNVKVPVASETSPYLCQAAVSFSCFCLLPHFHGPRGDVCMLTRDLRFHKEILCCPKSSQRMHLCLYHGHSPIPESQEQGQYFLPRICSHV